MRKEIFRARAIPRDTLLEKVNDHEKQNKITFNITYNPVFRDVREILKELDMILASGDSHKRVFPDVPLIGFKNNRNLKAHLVSSHLPVLDEVSRMNRVEERNLLVVYVKILKHMHFQK